MNLEMDGKSFGVFKDFMSLMKLLNDEITLNVDETGIGVIGMDPSHVMMIDAKILPGLFETFTPSEKMITINVAEFCKFLDRIGKDERPTIRYDKEKAQIQILAKKAGYTRRFTLSTLEPLQEEVPKPKIFFKAKGRILTQSVERAIRDAELVSEHIKFVLNEDVMKIVAVGDTGSADNEFEKNGDELLELKVEEAAAATFTLSYLRNVFGVLKNLTDVVNIELSTDMPIKIEAAAAIPNIEATLYLAPCIGIGI